RAAGIARGEVACIADGATAADAEVTAPSVPLTERVRERSAIALLRRHVLVCARCDTLFIDGGDRCPVVGALLVVWRQAQVAGGAGPTGVHRERVRVLGVDVGI